MKSAKDCLSFLPSLDVIPHHHFSIRVNVSFGINGNIFLIPTRILICWKSISRMYITPTPTQILMFWEWMISNTLSITIFDFFLHQELASFSMLSKAAIQAGWVDYQCLENITLPDPTLWGWTMTNGRYCPLWQNVDSPIDISKVVGTCSCQQQKMHQLSMQ